MSRVIFFLPLGLVLAGSLMLLSCSRESNERQTAPAGEGHGAVDWKFTFPRGNPAEGRKVFVAMECYKCHEIAGETFPSVSRGERGVGPELSHMAGMHPVEFFAESIVNADAVIEADDQSKGYLGADGKSKMPSYNGVLTVQELIDLVAYLAALKPEHSDRSSGGKHH